MSIFLLRREVVCNEDDTCSVIAEAKTEKDAREIVNATFSYGYIQFNKEVPSFVGDWKNSQKVSCIHIGEPRVPHFPDNEGVIAAFSREKRNEAWW